jgi:RimJ/RimL family protein N-acetyltransferase
MIERDSGSAVGDIGFKGPPEDTGRIEIGYSVIPDRRRRGYAKEAARALIDWALSQPKVRVIVAGCHPDNVPSIRTLERVGFHRTGKADGEIRWRYGSYSDEVRSGRRPANCSYSIRNTAAERLNLSLLAWPASRER